MIRVTKKKRLEIRNILETIFLIIRFLVIIILISLPVFLIIRTGKKSVWNGRNNLNLVIQTDKTFIYSYHPKDNNLKIIVLANELMLETAKGYGDYQLKNIYELGITEKIGGGDLLIKSLQNYFASPIDGYVIKPPPVNNLTAKNEDLEKGRIKNLFFCLVSKQCLTNISLWDLVRLYEKTYSLKLNQIMVVQIEETPLIKKIVLADQSEVLKLETREIDDFSQKYFHDQEFAEANLKVTVVNAAAYPGLAKNANRLLTNLGVNVISAEESEETEESCLLYKDKQLKNNFLTKKLASIFRITKLQENSQIKGNLNIVLGKDFVKSFYTR